MKHATTAILALLAIVSSARATITYDATNSLTLQFSHPWESVAPGTDPTYYPGIGPGVGRHTTGGTGAYTAGTDFSNSTDGLTFTQMDRAFGSAGNSTLDVSGDSFAQSFSFSLFTFDFGTTPTDFTVSVLDWAYNFGVQADRPPDHNPNGEFVTGGGAFYQIVLDNDPYSISYFTNVHQFYGLTGVHTFRVGSGAALDVAAVYPFTVPDSGSSVLLFAIGLVALGALKARVA